MFFILPTKRFQIQSVKFYCTNQKNKGGKSKLGIKTKEEEDELSAILELRPGPGGTEAAIFAHDMLEVYENYAYQKGWKFTRLSVQVNSHTNGQIGLREATCSVKGKGVFSFLKFESGVHRVQRVPVTESSGRLHTSTMSVVVLPEYEEMDFVEIPAKDLKIDTFRATGAGGQHVNTTDSAVRMTHIPSGIVVSVQNERNQIQNRKEALTILNAKVYQWQKSLLNQGRESSRSSQIGTSERHERIRTYNFPQDRITDHRINESFFGIDDIITGALLVDIHEKLKEHEENAALEALLKEEQEEEEAELKKASGVKDKSNAKEPKKSNWNNKKNSE
jgi:peptide chain release factor 1